LKYGSQVLIASFWDIGNGRPIGISTTGTLLWKKQAARDNGFMTISTSVTNKSDADRILRKWAKLLVAKLDEVHGK